MYGMTYSYDLADSLISEAYPSGRVVNTTYDGAERPSTVSGTLAGTAKGYITSSSYAPHGGIKAYAFGNSIWHEVNYNSRMQPYQIWDVVNNDLNRIYRFQCLYWGSSTDTNGCIAKNDADNNGNLRSTWFGYGTGGSTTSPTFSETFSYDRVNRLTGVVDSGGWSRYFAYDQYSNMWLCGYPGIAPNGSAPAATYCSQTPSGIFDNANRIGGRLYDAAGNQLSVTGSNLSYDAENRITAATQPGIGTVTYTYDGNGRRVMKMSSSGPQTAYVYDAGGELVSEYSLEASSTPPCQTCYLSLDHLGSTRLVTDQAGNTVSRHDYIPFGEEIAANTVGRDGTFGTQDFVNQKFTGKERDRETGLDYFGTRYYSAALGRFNSPDSVGDGLDPVPVPWANFENPQSLNLYTYVRNNPLANSDPDGNDCVVQTRTDYEEETVTVSSGNCDNVNVEDGQTKTYIAGTVDVSSIKSNGSGGIAFGYTPYQGGGGVADLQGASIPDNRNLAYYWQNNAQGYQTIRTTAGTVGSVKGVALFYAASTATAACALFCVDAAAALPEAANEISLKAMAYLESNGIPATKAAELVAKMGVNAGRAGLGTALGQAWRQLTPKLNEAVRDYRQSQNKAR